MQIYELAQLIGDGVRPVVTFKRQIADQEGYLDEGMRGRLVAVIKEVDGLIKIQADLREFDEFNMQFEQRNYFDKDGVPCLTAREAGFYSSAKPEQSVYFDRSDASDGWFVIEDAGRLSIYERFQREAPSCSYVQWLEDLALAGAKAKAVN